MRKMKRTLLTLAAAAMCLAGTHGVFAEDTATMSMADALKGKLIKIDGDAAKDTEMAGSPEIIIAYHSASW